MAEPWSEDLDCRVRVGIWNPQYPWIHVDPPPHKGYIERPGQWQSEWRQTIQSGTAQCPLVSVANERCNWRWVAYRWRALKYDWDQTIVETEEGRWFDQNHVINFSFGEYHPKYFAVTFEVFAEFNFQGTGLLLRDSQGRLVCTSRGVPIIDR